MSSIETQPISVDREKIAQLTNAWRAVLVTVGLVVMWLSFEPFSGGQTVEAGGSLFNQVAYTALTGLALLSLLVFVHPAVLRRLLSPAWLLLFAWVI